MRMSVEEKGTGRERSLYYTAVQRSDRGEARRDKAAGYAIGWEAAGTLASHEQGTLLAARIVFCHVSWRHFVNWMHDIGEDGARNCWGARTTPPFGPAASCSSTGILLYSNWSMYIFYSIHARVALKDLTCS